MATLVASWPSWSTQSAARSWASACPATPSRPHRNSDLLHTSAHAGSRCGADHRDRQQSGSTRRTGSRVDQMVDAAFAGAPLPQPDRRSRAGEIGQLQDGNRLGAPQGVLDTDPPPAALGSGPAEVAVAAGLDEEGSGSTGEPLGRPADGQPLADATQVHGLGTEPHRSPSRVELRSPRRRVPWRRWLQDTVGGRDAAGAER